MKKLRILSLVLAMTMTATMFAGCAKPDSTSTDSSTTTAPAATDAATATTVDYSDHVNADGKTFVTVGIDSDPGTYDPALFGSPSALDATGQNYREALFEMDETGGLIPQLAKDYTVDEDGLTYHIEIYDYIYDSEGNHITADDIVFCFTRAKEKAFNGTSFYDAMTKDDDYNVTIVFNNKTMGVFAQVMQAMKIYSQKAFEEAGEENFGTHPVFTGRYKLTDWQVGTSLTFEINENYWQKEGLEHKYAVANVDVIEYVIVKESAQQAISLETGQLDMVSSMAPLDAKGFMEGGKLSEDFNVFEYTDANTQLLYLNDSESSPFYNNLDLRNAVMYAIDTDGLIDGTVDGNAVACKTFGNASVPEYLTKWDSENYFDYDPDFAKESFENSGFSNETPLRIVSNNSELHVSMAQILQAYLLEVGIKSEILTYENTMYRTYIVDPTAWDIIIDNTGWNGVITTKWRDQFGSYSAAYRSETFTQDTKFFELLDAAMNADTYSEDTVDAFHQYLKEQAYARGLFNQTSFAVASDVVTEMFRHRDGYLFPSGCTYVWNK